jgi:hypothetical protein
MRECDTCGCVFEGETADKIFRCNECDAEFDEPYGVVSPECDSEDIGPEYYLCPRCNDTASYETTKGPWTAAQIAEPW